MREYLRMYPATATCTQSAEANTRGYWEKSCILFYSLEFHIVQKVNYYYLQFWLFCSLGTKTKVVSPHCPKNNMNLGIKTEPVTVGADTTVYVWFLHVQDTVQYMSTY